MTDKEILEELLSMRIDIVDGWNCAAGGCIAKKCEDFENCGLGQIIEELRRRTKEGEK